MLGDYVKHPRYGIGKVIRLGPGSELVYFFKEDEGLHDGAIEPGACEDNHGWWFSKKELQCLFCDDNSLKTLIEIRKAKI